MSSPKLTFTPDQVRRAVVHLVQQYTDPESELNKLQRGGRTGKARKEWEAQWVRRLVFPYPQTAYDINCGHCESFAHDLAELCPGGEVLWLDVLYINDPRLVPPHVKAPARLRAWIDSQDLPSHAVYRLDGRYYDAMNPSGVSDWLQLDAMRYVHKGLVTRLEWLIGRNAAGKVSAEKADTAPPSTTNTSQ